MLTVLTYEREFLEALVVQKVRSVKMKNGDQMNRRSSIVA